MSAPRLLTHPATLVWLALCAATLGSWLLGRGGAHGAAVGIIFIALIKIRFIIMRFMEIRHAPWLWRCIFDGWLVIVGVAMTGLYLFAR